MAGRTERVNARDLMERADGILFEGEAVRAWLGQLERRARGAIEAGKKNKVVGEEWPKEYEELNEALQAIQRAYAQLEIFEEAVTKREGR
ncbi:MAG: hypothetical protein HYV07_26850 [Deltaproteobacteria bacterium]|nr:hypothetical protein [Deltaproteobacteria bacterium]